MPESPQQQIERIIRGYEQGIESDKVWLRAQEAGGESSNKVAIDMTKEHIQIAETTIAALQRSLDALRRDSGKKNMGPAEQSVAEEAPDSAMLLCTPTLEMPETREQEIQRRIKEYEAELAVDEAWIAAEEASGEERRPDRIEGTRELMEGARKAVARLSSELENLRPKEEAQENKRPAEDVVLDCAAEGSTFLGSCFQSIKEILGAWRKRVWLGDYQLLWGGSAGCKMHPTQQILRPDGGKKRD